MIVSGKHPTCDAICYRRRTMCEKAESSQKGSNHMTPLALKQALWPSGDVMLASRIRGSKLKRLFLSPGDAGFPYWPQRSTGVERYGCILRHAANNLGEIPEKKELQIPCFEEFVWGANTSSLPYSF